MHAMPVRWKVKQFLDGHGMSTYRLWKESGLAMGTAYRLVRGDTTSLNADTLDKVMGALRRLTGKPVGLSDLLLYEPPAVFVVHHERDVATVVDEMVRRRHPSHHLHEVERLGLEGAVAGVFGDWVKFGHAFATEAEAEEFVAADDGRRELFIHAVAPTDLVQAFFEAGVLVDDVGDLGVRHG